MELFGGTGVLCLIDGTHATFTEFVDDLIPVDSLPDHSEQILPQGV